jgi:hypothetical protein
VFAAKLKRFEEREPLVQALVAVSADVHSDLEYWNSSGAPALKSAFECVRNFKVNP